MYEVRHTLAHPHEAVSSPAKQRNQGQRCLSARCSAKLQPRVRTMIKVKGREQPGAPDGQRGWRPFPDKATAGPSQLRGEHSSLLGVRQEVISQRRCFTAGPSAE